MNYSWHKDYYEKNLKELSKMAEQLVNQYDIELALSPSPSRGEGRVGVEGWLPWLEQNHPELYQRYEAALSKIADLWGDMDPQKMEEWKKAVKNEVDATKWAIEKYIEDRKKKIEEEAMKGTQEVLV
jgi:hypothetical protein